MLDYEQLRALNECVDTTFGRSSIRDAGHAVHCKILNGMDDTHILEIRFESIVTTHPHKIESTKLEYDDVSIKALNEEIKKIKADFKDMTGKTLNATKGDHNSRMDIYSYNPSVARGRYFNTIEYKIK